jgi:hypothetical protein
MYDVTGQLRAGDAKKLLKTVLRGGWVFFSTHAVVVTAMRRNR